MTGDPTPRPCDCKWSAALEKRIAHVEDTLATLLRGHTLRISDGHAVAEPARAADILDFGKPIRGSRDFLRFVRAASPRAAADMPARGLGRPNESEGPIDPHIAAAVAEAFREARRAEVDGYSIDPALFLLDELSARGCRVVRSTER